MSSQDVDDPTQFENITPDPNLNEGRPLSRWQKFRLVVKVVELRLRFIVLMAAHRACLRLLGHDLELLRQVDPAGRRPCRGSGSDIEYYCPMHPSVVRDAPGNCPICGMPLSRRKKGEQQHCPKG